MKKPLRILHIEDNPDDAQLVIDELTQAGYDVVCQRVETAAAMRKALRTQTWDLVLADYALPNFSAAAALWLVKQAGYDVPFIIVSGTITDETAVAAIKAGAHDYVTKDHLARLAPAVQRELADAALRADRARLTQELHREQDRFRAIVEKSPDALAILDGAGRIIYVSPPIERIAGCNPHDWINRPLVDFVAPEWAAALAADVAEVREKASAAKSVMYQFHHCDGSWRSLALVLTNLLNEPSVRGILVSLRDVNAGVRAPEEARRPPSAVPGRSSVLARNT